MDTLLNSLHGMTSSFVSLCVPVTPCIKNNQHFTKCPLILLTLFDELKKIIINLLSVICVVSAR